MDSSAPRERNERRRQAAGIERQQDVQIPVRDGNYLLADVFRPAGDGRHPVIVRLGVYGRAFDCGAVVDESSAQASEEREDAWHTKKVHSSTDVAKDIIPPNELYENMVSANVFDWVPRGYVCLRVDARGVGKTPGVIDPLSAEEAHDYCDVIAWAAEQPWSNGRVGVYGGSYNAITGWNVAGMAPPALKALIAFAGDTDLYREFAHPGGLAMVGFIDQWVTGNVKAVQGWPDPEVVDILQKVLNHPFDDPAHYGPHGSVVCSVDRGSLRVPFLTSVCLGAPIHGRGGAEAFATVDVPGKELLVVDANYWPFMYHDCLEQQMRFFDRHLKGDESVPAAPPVRVVQRTGGGAHLWLSDTQWPLSDTTYNDFFLDASTTVSGTPVMSRQPPTTSGLVAYSAEAKAGVSPQSAVFETPPLADDLELAGPVSAILWVSASATDMDVYTLLRVLDPAGREVSYAVRPLADGCPLSHGCLKVSHRATDPALSTPYRPWHTHREQDYSPLKPDEIVSIHVEMTLATARVPKGHRLQLLVEAFSSESSATWRAYGGIASPGTGTKEHSETLGGRPYEHAYHIGVENRIHTGPDHPSKLIIPTIPRQ
ncbi:hypothetical protein SEUCBS139899_009855 [Sporothrix eucalyptigena]|uniref:Xaa-Pro dipeptidyl-peptidase C-terminal domain-containing protein n=1 Tax=Sporothrix eucalyptigena TaxID=1812306 RepID=A0ABP0D190_9PEZI